MAACTLNMGFFASVSTVMHMLFTTGDILGCSVSGKKSNRDHTAKPRFDGRKFNVLVDIMKAKFPETFLMILSLIKFRV